MSDRQVKFRPTVNVWQSEEDGSYRLEWDWEDTCRGETEYNEDADEYEDIGHTDACDGAWAWLNDVIAATPAMVAYPPTFMPQLKGEIVAKLEGGTFVKYGMQVPVLPKVQWKTEGPEPGTIKTMEGKVGARRPPYPTCCHFIPDEKSLVAGVADLPDGLVWPFDRYMPYGTCTNVNITGPKGYGPCHFASGETPQPQCNGYKMEDAVVVGTSDGPTPVTISKRRVRLGTTQWRVEEKEMLTLFESVNTPVAGQALAIQYFVDVTGQAPVPPTPPLIPVPSSFLRSLVGANMR